jgi:hypothetical protein
MTKKELEKQLYFLRECLQKWNIIHHFDGKVRSGMTIGSLIKYKESLENAVDDDK